MKRNILKTTALFIVLSGLLFSCTLFEDDSPSEIVTAVTTKSEAAKKAVLSLSVAGEDEARTALPSVSSAQEFESFDFEANKGTDRITKSWTGDSEKSAYAKMTSESFEIDAGIWNFTLTAKKGGMTYTGTLNKELVAGANSIEFTLALSELSNEGKGSVEIKLSVPQSLIAVTATLCDTSENEVSDSSITQSTDLANNIVNYSAQNVPSGTYLVVFNLYADSEKTLLLGKWREYAGITNDVTSKSEIAIAEDDLDKVYTITYELNGGTLKGNWAGSYTRQMILTFPTQKDLVNNEGLKFDGWYTDENLTNAFNSASLTGNLTLYARWKTISVDELIESIKNKSIGDKAALVGEITSERLSEIVAAMREAKCYLALDLSLTNGLTSIGNEFKNCQYLTGISIPKTVTSIGSCVFEGCSGLESVTIPEGVTNIGPYAFYGCSELESVTIPSSVTSIGSSAFKGCSGLTEMTIPFVGKSVSATGESSLFGYIFGTFSYTGSSATLMYYSSSESETYYIPSSLKIVTVLRGELKYGAFYGCSGLESVTIGNGVTSIDGYAFKGCSGLKSVTIGNGVTSIEFDTFEGCSGLKSVTIGNGVTSIGGRAFYGCSGLESVTIPGSVTSIGRYAFSGCSGLESVTIPSSVTSIWDNAFYGCSGLTEMTIPFVGKSVSATGESSLFGYIFGSSSYTGSSATLMYYSSSDESETYYIPSSLKIVTVLGGELKYGAFSGCSGLKSVTIGNGVTSIGGRAFYGCSGLESVTIPSSVTSIGYRAFFRCSGLKSVTIPSSVTSIWESTFYGCSGLKSVTIPGSVTSIGSDAFYGCSGLESVYFDGTLEQWLAIPFSDYDSNPCRNGSDLYIQGNKITDLVIPEGVSSIGRYAFSGCSGLKSVTIPSSVTSIGSYAFYGCSGLESVTIPSSVTSIGGDAFKGCSGLESVTIGNGVTSIGGGAFEGCSGLKSVTIPSSVTSIGSGAFSGCSGLESVMIPGSVTSIEFGAFKGCSGLESVTIGNGVTSIGPYAFSGCSGLKSVTIPSSVTSIWYDAFSGCSGLESVTIPGSVTSIGSGAFEECSGLESVTIPGSVTSIGRGAFSGCIGLKSVTIPGSVTSIGQSTFEGCSGLKSVTIGNGVTSIGYDAFSGCSELESVTIPNSVKSIGGGAFSGCISLTEITIPFVGASASASTSASEKKFKLFGYIFGTKSYIGGTDTVMYYDSFNTATYCIPNSLNTVNITGGKLSYGAFSGCDGLGSVTIGNGVTSISARAFYNCSELESVTIPSSVTSIGGGAFCGCNELEAVYYRGTYSQWNSISVGDNNSPLTGARKIYDYRGD